ncbi:hypothetical protein RR46_06154 [Papilio xuthus]|uniref:Uncharacterized protein n=1 Tax=Papilio xuthus TaxID=66420 RepID=A0A194QHR6_PAPXU|nr:hypothetical protein RR46_06154 [Papilio xuthus]
MALNVVPMLSAWRWRLGVSGGGAAESCACPRGVNTACSSSNAVPHAARPSPPRRLRDDHATWQTGKRPPQFAEMAKQQLPIDFHNCKYVAYLSDGRHQAPKIQSPRPSPDPAAGADGSMTVARGEGSPERLGGALRRLHYRATRRAHSAAAAAARHHANTPSKVSVHCFS